MATQQTVSFSEELASFLATSPSREELLRFRPSAEVQEHARELKRKSSEGQLSLEEQGQFDQFVFAERLIRSIKAKVSMTGTGHG